MIWTRTNMNREFGSLKSEFVNRVQLGVVPVMGLGASS